MTDPAARDVTWTRDAAGRVVAQSDRRGHRSVLTRDGEGRLRVAALYRPGDDAPLRAAYLERDDAGRPSASRIIRVDPESSSTPTSHRPS